MPVPVPVPLPMTVPVPVPVPVPMTMPMPVPVPMPVAVRFMSWICAHSPAESMGLNLAGGMNICLLLSVVCRQVEVSTATWSLVQSSPTDCDVSLCVI